MEIQPTTLMKLGKLKKENSTKGTNLPMMMRRRKKRRRAKLRRKLRETGGRRTQS